MTKHTRGPWQLVKAATEWSVERDAVGSLEYQPICDDDGKIVAFAVDYSSRNFVELSTDHAHLIATAPELLAQLEIARNRINDMLMGDDGQAWKEARKALVGIDATIAKAGGAA